MASTGAGAGPGCADEVRKACVLFRRCRVLNHPFRMFMYINVKNKYANMSKLVNHDIGKLLERVSNIIVLQAEFRKPTHKDSSEVKSREFQDKEGKQVTLKENAEKIYVIYEGQEYIADPDEVRMATEMYNGYWPFGPKVDINVIREFLFDDNLQLTSIGVLPPLGLRIFWVWKEGNPTEEKHMNMEFYIGGQFSSKHSNSKFGW
jgi:hypothetical protein